MEVTSVYHDLVKELKIVDYFIETETLKVRLMNYGASVLEIHVPDKLGEFKNIVLTYPKINSYLEERTFVGASVGRVAGRIKNGKWQEFQLDRNEKNTHLHGGYQGFDNRIWKSELIEEKDEIIVSFTSEFADGLSGYPGELSMEIRYTITIAGELRIEFLGEGSKETLLNPTNHLYFNLSGNQNLTVLDHRLLINNDFCISLDQDSIPTNEKIALGSLVKDGILIRDLFKKNDYQLIQADGLNHPFKLNKAKRETIRLSHNETGRNVIINTNSPWVVCYTGNHFTDENFGKHGGIALECQNIVNEDSFFNIEESVIKPGYPFYQTIVYQFFVEV